MPLTETSKKIIATLANRKAPMTTGDLVEALGVGRRTIYTNIQKLLAMKMLVERPYIHDTRKSYYWFT